MTDPDIQPDKARLPLPVRIAALVIITIGLAGLLVPAISTAHWSGRTDLEVQFLVTKAKTGQAIPQATVHIVEQEELPPDIQPASFTLTTDRNGYARRMLKNCPCGGKHSLFEDNFSANLPYWLFYASAAGYTDSREEKLHTPEFAHAAKRGPPFATLLVPIRLE